MSETEKQVPMASLPQYQCHKKVWALQIDRIDEFDMIHFRTPGFAPKPAPERLFARGRPWPGDYLVKYDNGYWSWSPRKAFEEGYTRI